MRKEKKKHVSLNSQYARYFAKQFIFFWCLSGGVIYFGNYYYRREILKCDLVGEPIICLFLLKSIFNISLPFLYHQELTNTNYIFKAALKQADRKHSQDVGEQEKRSFVFTLLLASSAV